MFKRLIRTTAEMGLRINTDNLQKMTLLNYLLAEGEKSSFQEVPKFINLDIRIPKDNNEDEQIAMKVTQCC